MITITKTLNALPGESTPAKINLTQYSEDWEIIFNVKSTEQVLTSGTTAQIRGKKSDGTVYIADAGFTIKDSSAPNQVGIVTVSGSEQMTASAGKNEFNLLILSETGKKLYTAVFYVVVEPAPVDQYDIASESYIEALENLPGQITNINYLINNVKNLAEDAKQTVANAKVLGDMTLSGLVEMFYPVGSIRIQTVETNPSSYLGVGEWELWGKGRVPVGVSPNSEKYASAELTGGEETHTLSVNQIPAHLHRLANSTLKDGSVQYGFAQPGTTTASAWRGEIGTDYNQYATGVNIGCITTSQTGDTKAHNNMQPYITCYMFKRIS